MAYGSNPDIDYKGKADWLYSKHLLSGVGDGGYALEKKATRAEAALMVLRIMGKTSEALMANDSHHFKDVPNWASKYVGYMYRNGIALGISKELYGSNNPVSANDYTTLILRALGYSDKDGEFTWKNSLEYAMEIGLINKSEYDSLKQPEFTRADMVLLSYNAAKRHDKNPYTSVYLENLVDSTEPSSEVNSFREQVNSRRNGLEEYSFKYLDVYYPNTEAAKACLELIKPHADKAYMMLTDLYGIQAKVEVHFIDENAAQNLREGEIRSREHVTFVWLEENNDDGGNNLAEFIHEINHNFFSAANGSATNQMWINEANAKLIASLYTKDNYVGRVDQWSFFELDSMASTIKTTDMTFSKADSILRNARAWDKAEGEKWAAQRYGLYYWMKVFNTVRIDEFKYYLRNLGNGVVLPAIEKLTGRTDDETTEWMRE